MEYDVGFEMLDIYKPLGEFYDAIILSFAKFGRQHWQSFSTFPLYWIVAVGAEEPLADQMMIADFFR